MNTYTFHRANGFYPVVLPSNAAAIVDAENNPGTLFVLNISGDRIWTAPELEKSLKEELEASRRECAQLKEAIKDAMMHLETNFDIDGNSMSESDAMDCLKRVDCGKDFVRRELPDGLSFSDVIWHGKTDEEDAVLRGHLRHVLMLAAQAYRPAANLKITSESIKDGHGWRITVEEEALKAATAELA